MFFNLKNNFHENFKRQGPIKVGSDKQFGYTFSVLFFFLAVSPYLRNPQLRLILIVLSIILTAITLIEPSLLNYINKAWAKFGYYLGQIVSPIVLAILFFLVFTPIGLLLRLFAKDILDLKIDKSKKSYWFKSTNDTTSMKDQF